MPAKKKKPAARKKKKSGSWKLSWILPLLILVMVSATLAMTGYFIFLHTPGPAGTAMAPPLAEKKIQPDKPYQAAEKPREILQDIPFSPIPEAVPAPAPDTTDTPADEGARKPKVAIIIDDMGFHKKLDNQLMDMGINLTFSFLPFGPYTEKHSEKAADRRHDVLLHLPLEATDSKWNTGKGTLFLRMSDQEIASQLDADLASVPRAIGINNHMGSRFTADPRAMTLLLTRMKEKNLFFIDSITTSKSVGAHLAATLGIKSASRHIFLDNEQDTKKIIAQIEALVQHAEKHGRGVAIGHPYPETLAALQEYEKELHKRVHLVGISELIY